MTDRELLKAYVDFSDSRSLAVFLDRHQGSVLRFVARFLGDPHAAQDVVQETFLQVARHPQRLLGVESCHNWLLRVARNISVSHLRRETRRRRHAEKLARLRGEAVATAEPDAALVAEERRAGVRAQIDRLPPRQKEVLLLRIEESKTYREIAEITGLTATNVGYLLHEAMKTLSRRLAPRRGRDL